MTAPYSADTPDLLTRSLSHVVAARVVLPDGETVTLDVRGGRLSFDETRSPRVVAEIEARVPIDTALLERIDPRLGARLEVDAGYVRPGGTRDVHTIADLGLRDREVSRPADTLSLTAFSDEAILIDAAPGAGRTIVAGSTTAALTAVIQAVLPAVTPTVTAAGGAAVNEQYDDRWDMLTDLADRIEARVYDDGLRSWFIAPVPVLGAPMVALTVGEDGTLTATRSKISRGDDAPQPWANGVFLVHEWTDSGGTDHRIEAYRRITTGVYAAGTGTTKILQVERDSSISQANANAAAAALVARTVTRGRSLTVTGVSAYWVRPGHTADVTLPTGPTERQLVASVEFDLKTGLMDVDTRLPDNTGTIGA